MEDNLPTKLLDWLIPPVWALLSLKKHHLLHSSMGNAWFAHFKSAFLYWWLQMTHMDLEYFLYCMKRY